MTSVSGNALAVDEVVHLAGLKSGSETAREVAHVERVPGCGIVSGECQVEIVVATNASSSNGVSSYRTGASRRCKRPA